TPRRARSARRARSTRSHNAQSARATPRRVASWSPPVTPGDWTAAPKPSTSVEHAQRQRRAGRQADRLERLVALHQLAADLGQRRNGDGAAAVRAPTTAPPAPARRGRL